LESDSRFEPITSAILGAVENGKTRALASILVLQDLFRRVAEGGNGEAVITCQAILLNFPNLKFIAIDEQIAADAAMLQARHGLDAWNALHLSCARSAKARYFLTGDPGFPMLSEPETIMLDSIQP
jgi:predicted nucleic acid-binding protein